LGRVLRGDLGGGVVVVMSNETEARDM
jgi:hypothetical protein